MASTFHLATTSDSEKAKFEIVRTDKNKYVTTNTRVQYQSYLETIVNYQTEDYKVSTSSQLLEEVSQILGNSSCIITTQSNNSLY